MISPHYDDPPPPPLPSPIQLTNSPFPIACPVFGLSTYRIPDARPRWVATDAEVLTSI